MFMRTCIPPSLLVYQDKNAEAIASLTVNSPNVEYLHNKVQADYSTCCLETQLALSSESAVIKVRNKNVNLIFIM